MPEQTPLIHAVLDTNDFLEHRRFTEIPWRDILAGDRVVLVVPWKVVAELDANKSNNRSSTKRERARTILPLIERFSQLEPSAEVRPGITMEYFHGNVEEMCRKHDLTSTHPDHLIVASALVLREHTPATHVVLVTGDTGMRMTARRVGLDVIPMPEEYRLPHALDDEERERREMERELQRIQARRPKLSLGWGEDLNPALRRTISPRQPLSDQEFDALVLVETNKPYIVGREDLEDLVITGTPRYPYGYAERCREYVTKLSQYRTANSLMFGMAVSVHNSGTNAATDVRLRLSFPRDIILLNQEPKTPRQPARHAETDLVASYPPAMTTQLLADLNINKNVTSRVDENDKVLVMRIQKLRQMDSATSKEFFMQFASVDSVRPFEVTYHLVADELLEPIEGKLPIIVEIAAPES